MTEINFKGKEFVYNHHLAVPFRPLIPHEMKGIGPVAFDGNMIIHGDNLDALKALMPLYAGKVDCIFIDPPYNTGNEGWCYNDNVRSPMIEEWFKANPIGIEDGLRHDKWCAMMWPRLRLLYELLSETGVIFVCIDDNELYNLRLMMDELFHTPSNWVGTIIWKNVTDNNPTRIAVEHEYIVCFAKNKEKIEKVWKSKFSDVKDLLVKVGKDFNKLHKNKDKLQDAYTEWFREHKNELWPLDRYKYIDKDGIYTGSQSVHNPGREGYRYDIPHPQTKKPCKQPLMGYRFPFETMKDLLAKDLILFGEDESKIIELKVYAKDYQDKLPSVIEIDGRTAAYELRDLFPEQKKVFDNPKPTELVERILSFATSKNSLVLDSFSGSGTTAHSVLRLNKKDDGSRRFILIEGEDYAESLTKERVFRTMKGVPKAKSEPIKEGLGGTFTYCTLGEAIALDKILKGESLPDYKSLGAVLYHMATSQPVDPKGMDAKKFRLGEINGQIVWLIYKPDLEWLKSSESALTLQRAVQFADTAPDKKHLVFAAARFVSQKMLGDQNIPVEFVPLPYGLYKIDRS